MALAAGYEIELEGVVTDVGNVLTYEFTGLPETPHDARIRAYDGAEFAPVNYGPWSAIITDTPLEDTLDNWALASNGSTASGGSGIAANLINGVRYSGGNYYGHGGAYVTITVDFGASRSIQEIDIIGLPNGGTGDTTEPSLSDTGSIFLMTAWTVDYWNGSTWVNIPSCTVSGNNKVWRQFTFSPVTGSKIRWVPTAGQSADTYAVEIEAWG
jgi:hypothetical protein